MKKKIPEKLRIKVLVGDIVNHRSLLPKNFSG